MQACQLNLTTGISYESQSNGLSDQVCSFNGTAELNCMPLERLSPTGPWTGIISTFPVQEL